MATMIPFSVSADANTSEGELLLFRKLRDDPATNGWYVLHSLDIADHRKQVSGEIDFVVIVPEKGVLCLEVKGCHRVHRDENGWYYGKSRQPDYRGPFKQAADAMHSLRDWIGARDSGLMNVPFWSAVIFPFIAFEEISPEWHSWQIVDTRLLNLRPIGITLSAILDKARNHLSRTTSAKWFNSSRKLPDQAQVGRLVQLLRPRFEYFENPKARKRRTDEQVKHYTETQFAALDQMSTNSRVLFIGPAGTGKTMLAIEAARRACEANHKVLFLCYNRLLGNWLREQIQNGAPNMTVGTMHRQMLHITGEKVPTDVERFWDTVLPTTAIDQLLADSEGRFQFDELIIDEAQDLLQEPFIDFLDLSLKGGLAKGRWRFFADFERQAIYGSAGLTPSELQERYAGPVTIFSLRDNCRNTPRVAEHVYLLGGLDPKYRSILRPDDMVNPDYRFYRSTADQEDALVHALENLYAHGYHGNDIAVLSMKRNEESVAAGLSVSPWRQRLATFNSQHTGYIGYASVHAFKGMEARAIIVTDIERLEDRDLSLNLFYIAVTRSLGPLTLLIHDDAKDDIRMLLQPKKPA